LFMMVPEAAAAVKKAQMLPEREAPNQAAADESSTPADVG